MTKLTASSHRVFLFCVTLYLGLTLLTLWLQNSRILIDIQMLLGQIHKDRVADKM